MTTAARPALQHELSGLRRSREGSALLLIVVLALALRLPWMTQSLWYDEVSVTHRYLANAFHLLEAWAFESNMPVHYTVMFFWDRIFPDTEFSLRVPPLLFGLGAVVLTYHVARAIFSREIARLASLLLGISPVHIWYSAEARPYAGMMCFLLLALLAYLNLQDPATSIARARRAWWLTYFVSLLLGTLSHLYMAVPVVVLSGIAVLQRKRALVFLTMNAVVLLCLGGMLWFKYRVAGDVPTGAGYLRPFSAWELWLLFFNWYATGNTLFEIGRNTAGWRDLSLASLACQLFFCALFLKGLAALVLRPGGERWRRLIPVSLVLCIPLFLLGINAAGLRATYIERSCFVGLPFYFMILASAVLHARPSGASLLFLAGVLLLSGLSTSWLFWHPYNCAVAPCKPDWRAAAGYLAADIGTAGPRVATVSVLAERSLPYYDDRFADRQRLIRLRRHLPRLREMAANIFGPTAGVVGAFTNEMRRVDGQLEDSRTKIAVLSLVDVTRAGPDSYDVLYATDSPRARRRPRPILQWLGQHDFHLVAEQSFPALTISTFVRQGRGR